MATNRNRRSVAALAIGTLVVAACSGDDDADRIAVETVPPTEAPPAEQTEQTADDPADDPASNPTTAPAPTDPPGDDAAGADDGLDDWTFMVYVMGDNDLEPFAVDDLLEMSRVGSTEDVNVVTLVDRHPAYFVDDDPLDNFEDTKLLVVQDGDLSQSTDVGEVNVGDPDTLADFIAGSIAEYPAERYAVVLWNHGAGWPGMGPDETDGNDILDLAEINTAFEDGLAAAGVDKVDLVGFDACLMASYEVATTMADHARFMLASEELEPGHGWNYEALQVLLDQPDATTEQLGQSIIDGFAAQAAELQQNAEITLSLLDLTGMETLEAALGGLAEPLIAQPAEAAPLLAGAQSSAMKFGANPDPSLDSYHVDLGDVLDSLSTADAVLTEPAGAARAALDQMVVAQITGPVTEGASGMSIYFPPYPDTFRQGYLFLEDVPVWPDVLQSYFSAGEAIPEAEQPDFTNADGQGDYFFDEDGLNLFGTFDLAAEGNLVEATIYYGVLDETDDSIIFIGEEPGEVSDDGSGLAGAVYDLTVLTISDGVDTDYAYLDLEIDVETETMYIDVPLWYVPPEEFDTDDPPRDVVLSLVLDFEGNIWSEVYYVISDDGTYGELDADPDGLIYPVVLNEYPDGTQEWLTLSEQGLWANLPDLEYDLEPLESGTALYAELVLFDYGGNTDSVAMFDLVP